MELVVYEKPDKREKLQGSGMGTMIVTVCQYRVTVQRIWLVRNVRAK